MPPDYSDDPRKQGLAPVKEIELQPSTIETIDRAIFEFVDEDLDIFCSTNKGFKKVPFIWAGAERAYQIKHDRELRDVNGWLSQRLYLLLFQCADSPQEHRREQVVRMFFL